MRSVNDNILASIAVAPIAASSVQTSAALDTKGYNSVQFVVMNGAATGTPSSYTVDAKVQECATSGGSYTDVTGATITQMTADGKTQTIAVEGLGTTRLRYLKLLITPAMTGGTSPKALVAVLANFGRAYVLPVSNTN